MLRIVVDNSAPTKFRLFTCSVAFGVPAASAREMLNVLRDLAIDLRLRGVEEPEARDEMKKSMRYLIAHNATSAAHLDRMARAGEHDIEALMDLARPLRARPQQPTDKPAPKADPGPDDIIDVDFEIVDEPEASAFDRSTILFARAA